MILVTRLNDAPLAVNADLIERVTADPDTTLTMVDGVRYVVRESLSEIVERVTDYHAETLSRAYHSVRGATATPAERN